MQDKSIRLKGCLELIVERDGKIHSQEKHDNLIVNGGKALVAGLLNGVITDYFSYVALGTDNTAAAVGQTALLAEITTDGGERVAATTSRVTTSVTNDTAKWVATWNITGTLAVREAGIFDDPTAGNMLSRRVTSQDVENGDILTANWTIQVTT